MTGLDSPTLREIWNTAPYLHNGSAATPNDTINAHTGVNVSGAEYARKCALLAGGKELFETFLPKPRVMIDDTYITDWPFCVVDRNSQRYHRCPTDQRLHSGSADCGNGLGLYGPCSKTTPLMTANTTGSGMGWIYWVLLTIGCWGVYGVFLHSGAMGMQDPQNGRIKAFLFVGIAYFLTAVLAPAAILVAKGASWSFPSKGLWWPLFAGIVGAVGALGVLLAFGAKGSPAVVMTLIFAGAPIINAVYALIQHPPTGGYGSIHPLFFVGILCAALGGALVTLYKPAPVHKAPAVSAQTAAATPGGDSAK